MPAQQLTERAKGRVVGMGLPANSSSAALVRKSAHCTGGLGEPEFCVTAGSGRVTTRQWVAVGVLVYVNLINYMDRLTLAGILDDIKLEFNASNAMAGLLQTAFIISYMVFAPLFGYLGDRYSRKAIMAFGVFLWSIFTLIGSFMTGSPDHRDKGWANPDYWMFLGCRAMVGIGEASYSTIAPTIISDMFVKDVRSRMLALFYFAIPVGSGLGYIVGSETAKLFGHWQWGLRATPVMGIIAVVLILLFLLDPPRGESEGHQDMEARTYKEDIASLWRNKSFVYSTLAFTCVTFCTGALSWWGPKYIEDGLRTLQKQDRIIEIESVALIFGAVTMTSGIIGVPLGMVLSTRLKAKNPRADPVICGVGLFISAILLSAGMLLCNVNIVAAFALLFLGEVALNLNWSIVADMLLYIVTPTCRSTAEAIQILASHTFGDAGSPYLIGLMSDGLREHLVGYQPACPAADNSTDSVAVVQSLQLDQLSNCTEQADFTKAQFQAMQYSLFTNCGVELLGGVLFLITAIYIVRDKLACESAASESRHHESGARLMLTPTNYSPEDSMSDEMPSDDDEMPKLKLIHDQMKEELSSSRSSSP